MCPILNERDRPEHVCCILAVTVRKVKLLPPLMLSLVAWPPKCAPRNSKRQQNKEAIDHSPACS